MTIVVVTHDLDSLYAIADHVVVLDKGKMRYEGGLAGLAACSDPFIVQFLKRQPSRESRILGKPWSQIVGQGRLGPAGVREA
jgi:phospholipid/cholesterol/gamma-HCH transport system ATP-binding protein